MDNKCIAIIGLDGVSKNLADEWLKLDLIDFNNSLNFKSISSTVPPLTFTAWATIHTGLDPSHHGLLDFTYPIKRRGNIEIKIQNYKKIIGKRFIDIAASNGKKVLAINLPLTFDTWVSQYASLQLIYDNLLSPINVKLNQIYSPNICKNIRKSIIQSNYLETYNHLNYMYRAGFEKNLMETLIKTLKLRLEFLKRIIKSISKFDLFSIHFTETDVLLHNIWYLVNKDSPHYSPILRHVLWGDIKRFFSILNEIIDLIVQNSGSSVIFSDHGFTYIEKKFYPNMVFEEVGLIDVNKTYRKKLRTLYKLFLSNNKVRKLITNFITCIPRVFKERIKPNLFNDFSFGKAVIECKALAWITRNTSYFFVYVYEKEQKDMVVKAIKQFKGDIIEEIRPVKIKCNPIVTFKFPDLIVELKDGYVADPTIILPKGLCMTTPISATGCHETNAMIGLSNTLSKNKVKSIQHIPSIILEELNIEDANMHDKSGVA